MFFKITPEPAKNNTNDKNKGNKTTIVVFYFCFLTLVLFFLEDMNFVIKAGIT